MSKESDAKHIKNEIKLETLQCLKEEREISDGRYAKIIVERGFFALVTILCLAVLGALIKLVIIQ